jgi:hypothetical protein
LQRLPVQDEDFAASAEKEFVNLRSRITFTEAPIRALLSDLLNHPDSEVRPKAVQGCFNELAGIPGSERTEWGKQCTRINHDWLQNYEIAISAAANVGAGLVTAKDGAADFIENTLPQWEMKRKEVLEIAANFEREMNPKALFKSEPLLSNSRMREPWIANLVAVHSLLA